MMPKGSRGARLAALWVGYSSSGITTTRYIQPQPLIFNAKIGNSRQRLWGVNKSAPIKPRATAPHLIFRNGWRGPCYDREHNRRRTHIRPRPYQEDFWFRGD